MAVRQLARKKSETVKGKIVKKKKLERKSQLAKKKVKFRVQKPKKAQSRVVRKAKSTPRAKAVKSPNLKICTVRYFVSKMLRQMPKVRMEAKARGLLKNLLMDLYNEVKTNFEGLSQQNDLSSISSDDVQNFLNDAMAKELAKYLDEPIPATTTRTASTSKATATCSA